MNVEHIEITVAAGEKGQRLDVFVTRKYNDISRSQVKRALEDRRLLVNRVTPKAGYRLRQGDIISYTGEAPLPCKAFAENIPLSVVYEDPHIMIVNKPAGMVVHPAPGHYSGTLVNAILFHCHDLSGVGGVLRPGIVHRLDKDTSGLIIIAKSDQAHRRLTDQFKRHEIRKTYMAVVHGNPKNNEGTVELPVGRHPVDRKKMSINSRRGREALSRWQVMERFGSASLLEICIETGRTHQIRVHMNALGHPVIGDRIYGKPGTSAIDPAVRKRIKDMGRQALHAAHLEFDHPVYGGCLSFHAGMPDDMDDLCDFLRRYGSKE